MNTGKKGSEMMSDIQVFNNPIFGNVRTVEIDGEAWLVGKDVAEILGYSEPRSAVSKKVDPEDRGVAKMETPSGIQEMTIINESGFYTLVLGSKLPYAKKFKHWITSEVIPSIRKNGGYIAGQENMSDEELLEKAVLVAQRKIAERDLIIAEQQKRVGELETAVQEMDGVIQNMAPKVDYADRILSSTDCMLVTQIAQDYGMSAKTFNGVLKNAGIQRKVGDQWILYAEYQGKGYTKTRTNEFQHGDKVGTRLSTVWTQKGRMFLYTKLKDIGILPKEEQENEAT